MGFAAAARKNRVSDRCAPRGADPASIRDLITGYRAARVLFTAARLELFDQLSQGPRSLAAICATLDTRPRPTEALLDALAALGFLRKQDAAWELSSTAREHLLENAPGSLASELKVQDLLWDSWGELERVLREGKPRASLPRRLAGQPGFAEDSFRSASARERGAAATLVEAIDCSRAGALLAFGGSAACSLAFLERWRKLRVDLICLPETLRLIQGLADTSAHRDRLGLLPGDYRHWEPLPETYDVVVLSHVTNQLGETSNRDLLHRAHLALRPGGHALVHDSMTEDHGISPLSASLLSVHLGVHTEEGRSHGAKNYLRWLRAAGFTDIQDHPIAAGAQDASRLLIGRKEA